MKKGKSMGKAKQFGIGWCMAADNGEGGPCGLGCNRVKNTQPISAIC